MEHTRAFLAYDTLCRIAAEIPEDGEQLLEQCEEDLSGCSSLYNELLPRLDTL